MPSWVKIRLFEPTPFISRLLLIGLGGVTVLAGGETPSAPLIALAAAYGLSALMLVGIPPFDQPRWLL